MIYKSGKQISQLFYRGKAITAVYHGAELIWQAVRSCFGSGLWLNLKVWEDADPWKNN
jgi:hypothetical protein